MKIRTIILSPLILAIAGCATHESKPRTEKALELIEKIDPNATKEVVSKRLANFGRYLASSDSNNTLFNPEGIEEAKGYFNSSYGKDEEYLSLLILKPYLEEVKRNKSLSIERILFFSKILEEYENKDLICSDKLPSVAEVRGTVFENELTESYFLAGQISTKEFNWFNSKKWIEARTALRETEKMLNNITSHEKLSPSLREAFIYSSDYIVANKIFDIYSKGLLSEEDSIKLINELNQYFTDSRKRFKYSYIDGMRAQFLLKNVFPPALLRARENEIISDSTYTDYKYKHERDVQDETKPRHFSHLSAECSCLLHFSKLGISWKKEYSLGKTFTTAELVFPYQEPFMDRYNTFPESYYQPKPNPIQISSGK